MNVLDQAQNVRGVVSAARQRERWQQREVKASGEKREQYREAIADLEARFPELENVSPGGAEAFARERGHGKGAVHNGRSRSRPPATRREGPTAKKSSSPPAAATPPAGAGRKPIPGLDPTARRAKSSRRARGGASTPRVDRAIRRTGIPATLDSTGSAAMAGLGATVGLGLLYLVISSAEKPGTGAAAVPSMISSVTKGLGRFLSLGDIFPSAGIGAGRVVPGAKPVRTNFGSQGRNPRAVGRQEGIHGKGGGVELQNPAAEYQAPIRPHRPRVGTTHR
jgi:hypothetical protein